jgi:hypothetical protein
VSDEDPRRRARRQELCGPLEGLPRGRGPACGHERAAERQPRARLVGVLGGERLEEGDRALGLALVERRARALDRRDAAREQRERASDGERPALTRGERATRMREMTRETLELILAEAPGCRVAEAVKVEAAPAKTDKKASVRAAAADERTYAFQDEHRVSLYLSLGESGTVVSEVSRVTLGAVLRVEQKDRTLLFVEYPAVHGLSVRPPRSAGEAPRTGF